MVDRPAGRDRSRGARFEDVWRSTNRDLRVSRPVLALIRAEVRVTRALERALAAAGLTPPKFNVLMELAAAPDGRLPLCAIGRRLLKSAPNVTALIDRLEVDALVRRVRDSRDRRVVQAEITEHGWKALGPAATAVFAAEREVLRHLTAEDRGHLLGLLSRVGEPGDGEAES
jgi:MarR family 2-MHQ and catechol resistance regulon transcriptional repressor